MQSPPTPPLDGPILPVSRTFVSLYTAAQIGAYIAFIPLLTLLLPLKTEAIDPVGRAALLSQVTFWGALTAGIAGVLAGVLGDRARHWPGGRALWMSVGLVGTLASYGLIEIADSRAELLAAIVALQISLNFMLNPLAAILPERVPGRQKGVVAAFNGLAFPLSNLFGAIVIGVLLTTEADRLVAIVVVTTALVVPFIVMTFRTPRLSAPVRGTRLSVSALVDRDFLIAFGSRLLVHTAIALNVIYLLFFLDLASNVPQALPGVRIEVVAGGLLATSTVLSVIAGLVGGYVSDRLGRRRIPLFIGATLMAGGSLVMGVMPLWPGPLFAQALLGLGIGLYSTLDSVLLAEVLPSRPDTGQDLGVMNVAVTAAQMLAPSIGLIAVAHVSRDLQAVYLTGAVLALLGGAAVTIVRRVS